MNESQCKRSISAFTPQLPVTPLITAATTTTTITTFHDTILANYKKSQQMHSTHSKEELFLHINISEMTKQLQLFL